MNGNDNGNKSTRYTTTNYFRPWSLPLQIERWLSSSYANVSFDINKCPMLSLATSIEESVRISWSRIWKNAGQGTWPLGISVRDTPFTARNRYSKSKANVRMVNSRNKGRKSLGRNFTPSFIGTWYSTLARFKFILFHPAEKWFLTQPPVHVGLFAKQARWHKGISSCGAGAAETEATIAASATKMAVGKRMLDRWVYLLKRFLVWEIYKLTASILAKILDL